MRAIAAVEMEIAWTRDDFYAGIEAELKNKGLEGLAVSQVEYAEGGLLSAKRTYPSDAARAADLRRVRRPVRDGVVFLLPRIGDFLLAPRVGIARPARGAGGAVVFYAATFGWLFGSMLFGLSILGIGILMRNALAFGLRDLDASLLRVPIIGGVYEALLRKETYYREDTRAAYLKIGEVKREGDQASGKSLTRKGCLD